MTTNFYLDKKPNRKKAIIFMWFRYNRRILKYHTGLYILPKYWNKNKQRAFARFKSSSDFNTIISNLETSIEPIYYKLRGQILREPTVKELREYLKTHFNAVSGKQEIYLTNFLTKYIKEKKAHKNTKKTYTSLLNKLKNYENQKGIRLNLDSVSINFLENFVEFLYDTVDSDNTIAKYISNLKTTLREAKKKNLTYQTDFEDFTVSRKDPKTKVYLSKNEIQKIYDLNLSNESKSLESVRDLFIIACHTGLRFGDFSRLKKENIITAKEEKTGKEIEIIHTITNKTGAPVYVPVHYQVKALIEKYNGNFPSCDTNQDMNRKLKEIARLAGLDYNVEKITEKRDKLIRKSVPKYTLITTHTARRSFATNAILSKQFSIPEIMDMTGHQKVSTFMKYVKTTPLENALRNANSTHFTGESDTND